jgi:cytidyltransferase-like protein
MMLVYTVGTWDLLHVGHLAILQYCKSLGDTVAVGVASDEVVASYKTNIPVVPLDQRMEMLRALRCVDIVRPYYELEYASACKELDVDLFVIGEDWGKQPHNIEVECFLKAAGKFIVQVDYHSRTSSTKIKQVINSQFKKVALLKNRFK